MTIRDDLTQKRNVSRPPTNTEPKRFPSAAQDDYVREVERISAHREGVVDGARLALRLSLTEPLPSGTMTLLEEYVREQLPYPLLDTPRRTKAEASEALLANFKAMEVALGATGEKQVALDLQSIRDIVDDLFLVTGRTD